MHYRYRNVNSAFRDLVEGIHTGRIPTVSSPSRAGNVRYIQEPVTITYTHPAERVLFNQARDANPFFHLYEALHMLAGRNDVESLAYYNSRMRQFSDDGQTFNAAYGYRWRHHCDIKLGDFESPMSAGAWTEETDQLEVLAAHLRKNPTSRRAVLQIWNVEDDLLKVETTKDNACNVCVFFSLRQMHVPPEEEVGLDDYLLDMTVCNRSNDLVWGSLGANVVHFSFLQEYMAAKVGAGVGRYHQFSNNLHVYESNWKPEEWLADKTEVPYDSLYTLGGHRGSQPTIFLTHPLVEDPERFDRELPEFVERHSRNVALLRLDETTWEFEENFPLEGEYAEPFLCDIAQPMCMAFHYHKRRDYAGALVAVESIAAEDWKIACRNWINKRRKNWEAKGHE